jgi:hypothetical protein
MSLPWTDAARPQGHPPRPSLPTRSRSAKLARNRDGLAYSRCDRHSMVGPMQEELETDYLVVGAGAAGDGRHGGIMNHRGRAGTDAPARARRALADRDRCPAFRRASLRGPARDQGGCAASAATAQPAGGVQAVHCQARLTESPELTASPLMLELRDRGFPLAITQLRR